MNEAEPLQQIERTFVRFHGRKLAYFSGCDYYRLSSHPKVLAAVQSGVRQYGLNVAASRLTTGNHELYLDLEKRLARFFDAPDALLVSNGYLTNLVVAQALAGSFSHALIDEDSHPSLRNATRFLDFPVLQFRHLDAADLAATVRRCGPESRLLLLTDGMFSHDGTAAPLAEYLHILPNDAQVLVDDAHGAGVLGPRGRGSLEQAGVPRHRIIQTVTLSKAFGSFGGAILGTTELRGKIIERSTAFVGSTPPPLPLANAALQALKILSTDKRLKERLDHNSAYMKERLRAAGWQLPEAPGPIVSFVPETEAAASRLKAALLKNGILPPFIKYPGGPSTGYFRFVICSEHTQPQLDRLLQVLKSAKQ